MEEEVYYKTVICGVPTCEKPNNSEIIYDEVKTEQQGCRTNSVISENENKAALLRLVAASLGIICVILVSVVIALSIYLNTVTSEQERENSLERQKEELIRDRDGLKWTIGVILEYESFPVRSYCPQKGACKPCLDNWVPFQSNCYLFSEGNYSSDWKTWQESRAECKSVMADLVVIESREEQEFIHNHTKYYLDDKHGYWIGLNNNMTGRWMWLDKWNVTVTFWKSQDSKSQTCALTLPGVDPLANWQYTGCAMKNRWICERRALIKLN